MPGRAEEDGDAIPVAPPGPREGRPAVARVLLDSALPQLDHLFDYAVPDEIASSIRVGQRVRVPFRSRERKSFGYVIELVDRSEFTGELSPIADIVSPVPQLTMDVWRLARAVADRAGGSAGDILRLAIPARQVRVEKQHLAACAVEDEDAGDPAAARGQSSDGAAGDDDTGAAAMSAELVSGARLALTASHGVERLHTGEWVGVWAALLARTALAMRELGRSAILVVPDYRDLDQLRDALFALGGDGVADAIVRVDSRQSNAERYAGFLRALDPEPRIILGNRSAIYAPAHDLGAIVIWDDGDPVLAEPLAPYVHARDAALVRAEQSGAGLLLMAHARSAEVQRLVEIGYVRASDNAPRRTRVVHADASMTPDAFGGRLPEFAVRTIREGLRNGPVLVQVATPGFAPIAVCSACGDLAHCAACGGPIGFRVVGRASCRWCGEFANGWQCSTCEGRTLIERGMGSGRSVEQFEKLFPRSRVLLSDGDHPRERVDARPALVVATRGAEPLAAGGYRAVVLLDAERLLQTPTLRAHEDCLRWWENAAALAADDGVCLMASGGGDVVSAFVTGRTIPYLSEQLHDRVELRYPPAVRVASVTGGPEEVSRALDALDGVPGVDVLGPAPAPSGKRTGRGTPGGGAIGPSAGSGRGGSAHLVRAIVRFDYTRGPEVAKRLRGALVADAAGSSAKTRPRPGRARPTALRLRFDDRGVFDA